MNQGAPQGGGWTFLKVLGMVVGVLGLVGFGLCTLCGGFFVFGGMSEATPYFLLGLLMTGLCIWMVVAIVRSARRPPY